MILGQAAFQRPVDGLEELVRALELPELQVGHCQVLHGAEEKRVILGQEPRARLVNGLEERVRAPGISQSPARLGRVVLDREELLVIGWQDPLAVLERRAPGVQSRPE